MRLAAQALAVALLALAPLTLAAVTSPGPTGDHPNCGSLAPFENSCNDLRPFRIGDTFIPVVHVLGFAGTIRLTVIGSGDDDDVSALVLTCHALGAATEATLTCDEQEYGHIGRGSRIVMLCKVTPYPVEGEPLVGPSGPYGCEVLL